MSPGACACRRRRLRAVVEARHAIERELDRRRPAWMWSARLSALLDLLALALDGGDMDRGGRWAT